MTTPVLLVIALTRTGWLEPPPRDAVDVRKPKKASKIRDVAKQQVLILAQIFTFLDEKRPDHHAKTTQILVVILLTKYMCLDRLSNDAADAKAVTSRKIRNETLFGLILESDLDFLSE